jgi:acetyl esterase/lipase
MNKISLVLLGLICFSPLTFAQGEKTSPPPLLITVPVWPEGKMPGSGAQEPEKEMPPKGNNVQRITNVSQPLLTVFKAPGAAQSTPAVVICPGGGYSILAYNLEGTEIATWLNSIGITGVLLKYRVPNNRDGAFQDIQRTVRLVRGHAKDWDINPDRIGVMGFSAGGHLCARLSTAYNQTAYPKIDATDDTSCRPDFTLLVYPAYLADKEGKLAPEFLINAQTPPTFIAQTEDDKHFIAGTRVYQAALQAANVPNEFCCFATGGHGYGLRSTKEVSVWPQRCQAWLLKSGLIEQTGATR